MARIFRSHNLACLALFVFALLTASQSYGSRLQLGRWLDSPIGFAIFHTIGIASGTFLIFFVRLFSKEDGWVLRLVGSGLFGVIMWVMFYLFAYLILGAIQSTLRAAA